MGNRAARSRPCTVAQPLTHLQCASQVGLSLSVSVSWRSRSMSHLAQAQAGVGERTPWEVFYACPSASVDAFLGAAASLAPADPLADTNGASALPMLSGLAAATQVVAALTLTGLASLASAGSFRATATIWRLALSLRHFCFNALFRA